MFSAIAWIASLLFGLSTGATPGITNPDPAYKIVSANQCYSPSPSETVTLTWPDNFVNLTDKRVTLSPHIFSKYAPIFNTTSECRSMLFTGTNHDPLPPGPLQRTYIKVREHIRIASCKTDELAGPYGVGKCPDWDVRGPKMSATQARRRGTCEDKDYPELRKIAEVSQNGELLEIFWTPYSHDIACDFDPNDPNCGWHKKEYNKNLREFIYVLKSREAFDPTDPRKGCKVLWDAGSTNKDACSHYFDVYMAQDLYEKTQLDIDESDPDYQTYHFIKQAVENCRENSTFTPVVDVPKIRIPPQFMELPFVSQDFFTPKDGKITPSDQEQYIDYEKYVLTNEGINPSKTSLIELHPPSKETIQTCAATGNDDNCYEPIGTTRLSISGSSKSFIVYSKANTPQTFYLQEINGTDGMIYVYSITQDAPPSRNEHDPTLQLSQLRFSSGNEWTWATPQCKPALYLYPPSPQNLTVTVDIDGTMTHSDPPYTPGIGWNIVAYPDGHLTLPILSSEIQKTYPYLFYEALIHGVDIPQEGWVTTQKNLPNQMLSILKEASLNEKEQKDFMTYWIPKLKTSPYYSISLLPESVVNQKEKITITHTDSETPLAIDTLIRVRLIFEPLTAPISLQPPVISHHDRKGFVITDWGASIVGESCTDISVQ